MENNNEFKNLREVKKSSRPVYEGPLLHVYHDRVILPNGNETGRDLIRHVGAVCMIPVTEDGKVIVERQFRYPLDSVITEIPAGKLDSFREDRLSAAKRELKEETGYTGDNWVDLGLFYSAPAYSDEKISMYLVTGLHKGEQKLDDDEFLNIEFVPLKDLVEQVMAGEIPDAKTQTAILKAARILNI